MNNTITINNVPEQFECTGEYRPAKKDEWYFHDGLAWHCSENHVCKGVEFPILRKIERPKPPAGYELIEYREPLTVNCALIIGVAIV